MGSRRKVAIGGAAEDGTLAPGFRFHPTDEELVSYYLKRKVCGKPFRYDPISEIDIYRSEPWDLPSLSRLKTRDLQWYFFSALDKKYGNSSRTNRATTMGYWKTTGKDRPVHHKFRTVGMKKTLVYHFGRAPRGQRTNWVMHEYRLDDDDLGKIGIVQDAFVLCRIHQKSGVGPKNGEQYGAPFMEEDWDDDVLVLKEETGVIEDPSFLAGEQDHVQPDGHEQVLDSGRMIDSAELSSGLYFLNIIDSPNGQVQDTSCLHPGTAIRNDNVLPAVRLDDHDSFNNQPELIGFIEDQHSQKFLDGMDPNTYLQELHQGPEFPEGMDENTYLQELHPCAEYLTSQGETFNIPELPHNQAFGSMEENTNLSEFYQMAVKEDCVEVNDFTNLVEADCPAIGVVEDGCIHFDASYHDQPQSEDGCFLELDDLLNPGEANHASGFEKLDDLLMYFDATDDNLPSFDFESILAPEIGGVTSPETVKSQQELKPNTMDGASSSKQKLEEQSINDARYRGGWNESLAKRFTGMLGSIAAPPAFAAEYGLQEGIKSVGQNSNHSSSIQISTGMFYISDRLTGTSGEKPWSLQKGGNVGFLVSYGISGVDVITTEPNAEIPGKALSMLWRAGLYLCFIWVSILAVSFKIGSFIYSK